MLNRYLVTGAFAALTGSGALLAAQSPAGQTPASPTPPAAPVAAEKTSTAPTTVIGCVYREKDVPGRAPNIAERAGIREDYFLAEFPSSPIATARTPSDAPGAQPTAVGTSGTAEAMYKLESIDGDKAKTFVGRRVEVMGRIIVEPGDQVAPQPGQRTSTVNKIIGRDEAKFSHLEVSSIKEVAGTCPASPDPKP